MTPDAQKAPAEPFKRCSSCRTVWLTRDEFLSDPDLELVGYQVHFEDLQAGFLLFNHACRTTIAVEVVKFQGLYDGPVFVQRATGGGSCAGFCFHQDELRACPAQCECA